ncbi:hypothetical protein SV7mr_20970 [Stieleria bergensis]|uniref:Uncharacterized protein n=1 Tax=Stieleria bergensis TaxID=2528025 RepID=A0A517STX9_9BACT|nr:hypothetical protein SV7mr_20970 [Planctomycetes bacterium SV_7m_r]
MEILGQTFKGNVLDEMPAEWNAIEFKDCIFTGGGIGMKVRHVADRLVVRSVTAMNCTVDTVTVGPVVFENLHVENLKTTQHLWLPGCAFRSCVFRGKIGEVLQFDKADPMAPRTDKFNQQFIDDNEGIWSDVEWSLDISEAEFDDLDLRGVPGETVRINTLNQVCVDFGRSHIAQESGAFDELSGFAKMVMKNGLKRRKESKYNFVLTTNPSSRDYQEMSEFFEWLAKNDLLLTSP